MLTRCGKTKGEGSGSSIRPMVLPLWKKGSDKGIASKQGYGFGHGYPFVAPSVESLAPSIKVLKMKTQRGPKPLDPWVVRCRIAAVSFGILLLVAFVVTIAVVRHREHQ